MELVAQHLQLDDARHVTHDLAHDLDGHVLDDLDLDDLLHLRREGGVWRWWRGRRWG